MLIGDEAVDRQDRRGEGQENRVTHKDRRRDRGARRHRPDPGLDHHRPAGEKDGIDAGRVVVLAVEQDHHRHQGDPGDGDPALDGEPGPEGETGQAGQPDRRGERTDEQDLLQQIGERIIGDVAAIDGARVELQERPAVDLLPDEVGQHDEQRQPGGDPGAGAGQDAALAGQAQPDRRGDQEESDAVFVEEGNARDGAERAPGRQTRPPDRVDQDEGRGQPGQGLQGVSREGLRDTQEHRRDQHGQASQPAREQAAAEPPGRLGAQDRQRCCGQGRDEPQADQAVAEQFPLGAHEEGQEGRLIDIAQGQMLATGDEIELVAEIVVATADPDMKRQGRRAEDQRRMAAKQGQEASHASSIAGRRLIANLPEPLGRGVSDVGAARPGGTTVLSP